MKFSIKDFFSKCDQIRRKLRIWSHLLKKSLMENFTLCAVLYGFIAYSLTHFISLVFFCIPRKYKKPGVFFNVFRENFTGNVFNLMFLTF